VIKILVVDDSALVRKLFGGVFSAEVDMEVTFARNGVEALELLDSFQPDVVTLDVNMPLMNGLDCLDQIMVRRPCPVVMVSSLTEEGAQATLEALRLGAIDFLPKPQGAVSLRMSEFAPTLVSKVRAAATAKIRASRRLKERVKQRIAGRHGSSPVDTSRGVQ
jgi:two-component system chemotaxis response regulator CheB